MNILIAEIFFYSLKMIYSTLASGKILLICMLLLVREVDARYD